MAGDTTGTLTIKGRDANGNSREINVRVKDGSLVVRDRNVTTGYKGIKQANASGGAIKHETVPPDVTRAKIINTNQVAGDILQIAFGSDDAGADAVIAAGPDGLLHNDTDYFDIPDYALNGGSLGYISSSANPIDFYLSWI